MTYFLFINVPLILKQINLKKYCKNSEVRMDCGYVIEDM